MKQHIHAEVIKQWADGKAIECRSCITGAWVDCPVPVWMDESEYRVKPEPEEKVYPRTKMSGRELLHEVACADPLFDIQRLDVFRWVANAAIRRAIDDGQVVPLSEVAAYTDKRDMAVAKAVRDACRDNFKVSNTAIKLTAAYGRISGIDLAEIVAGVTP